MFTFYCCALLFSVFREFFFTTIINQSGHYFTFREYHPSFHWSGLFGISRISYIYHSLIRAVFCISRILSIFSLIRAFWHFANIIHLFIAHPSFYILGIGFIWQLLCFPFYPGWCAFVLLFFCCYPDLPLRRICA